MENQPQTPQQPAPQQGSLPPVEPPKPVAYDANGQPLYAAPPQQHQSQQQPPPQQSRHPQQITVDEERPQPQVVQMTRSYEPVGVEISDEVKKRHAVSMEHFPKLNLSEHEYIVSAVPRHPIGMIGPLLATALSVSIMFIFIMNYPYIADVTGMSMDAYGFVVLIGILMTALFLIGGYLAMWVYVSNRFFLTNESVIQEIQSSIFSRKEQTVSLMNIEDASFDQKGPIQAMLNYGSIRLSTEGEETTYRFDYVVNPKKQIAILNNAVEAFKNGRPVEGLFDAENDD